MRDTTEDIETLGDHSQIEEDDVEEAPFVEAPSVIATGTTEASAERKEEIRAEPPQVKKDPCTPPAPSLPAKLLTRLGSLDGEWAHFASLLVFSNDHLIYSCSFWFTKATLDIISMLTCSKLLLNK